jgi:hypothetical protein
MTTSHKTLVFHIGDRKTGSTSIQNAFAQGKVSLRDQTLFYPATMAHNHLKKPFKAWSNPERKAARKKAITKFENLAGRIDKSDADFCLISAEAFEGVAPAVLQDVITHHFAGVADEIRIVAYVRPHAARILSSFSERLKNGNVNVLEASLETFFTANNNTRRFHYLPRFSAWRDVFGDQFTLRPFISSQLFQGDVVADFVCHGFGQPDFQIDETVQSNQSLCLEDLMRLKVLQSHHTQNPKKLRHALGWELARLLGALPLQETRTKLRLHKSLVKDIQDAYLADARALDQMFFDNKPLLETELTQAVDQAAATAQSLAPSDWLGSGDIRSLTLLATLISDMALDDPDKWVTHWRTQNLDTMHQETPKTD